MTETVSTAFKTRDRPHVHHRLHVNDLKLPASFYNVEMVGPATLVNVVLSDTFDRKMKHLMHQEAGTIVTTRMLARAQGNPGLLESLRYLTSPYECGRVLDLSHTVQLDGIPYRLNMKGVGVTSHIRQKGSKAGGFVLSPKHRSHDLRIKLLEEFPYGTGRKFRRSPNMGIQTDEECLNDLSMSRYINRELRIKSEQVTGYGRVESLVGPRGIVFSTSDLVKAGIFNAGNVPHLLFRLQKDNFRVLDLDHITDKSYLPFAREFIESRATLWNVWNPDLPCANNPQSYLCKLFEQIAVTQATLLQVGMPIAENEDWTNEARNISLAGEWIDTGDISPSDANNFSQVEQATYKTLDVGIRILFNTYEVCKKYVPEINLRELFEGYFAGYLRGLEAAQKHESWWWLEEEEIKQPSKSDILKFSHRSIPRIAKRYEDGSVFDYYVQSESFDLARGFAGVLRSVRF